MTKNLELGQFGGLVSVNDSTKNISFGTTISGQVQLSDVNVSGSATIFNDLTVQGNLTVNGDTTVLDTTIENVDILNISANSVNPGVAITQSGSGPIAELYDSTEKVITITSDGKLGIGTYSPTERVEITNGGLRVSGRYIETTTDAGVFVGVTDGEPGAPFGDTPRIGFFNGDTSQNWQVDNHYGSFRWFVPGLERMKLAPTGQLIVGAASSLDVPARLNTVGYGTDGSTRAFVSVRNNYSNAKSYFRIGRYGTGNDSTIILGNNYNRNNGSYSADENLFGVNSIEFNTSGDLILSTGDSGETSPTERFRIYRGGNSKFSGNLGIGMSVGQEGSDESSLAVNGSIYLASDIPSSDRSEWRFLSEDTGSEGYLHIQDYSGASWNPNISVAGLTGNIGIGESRPTEKLQIVGNILLDSSESERKLIFNNGSTSIYYFGQTSGSGAVGLYDQTNGRFPWYYTPSDNLLVLAPDGSPVIVNGISKTGTASQQLQVNGGAYVSGKLGVGDTNPGERLSVIGNLRVGGSDSGPNYIAFRGTSGDAPGSYSHTYIGERIYDGSEKSELLLFKGNDLGGSVGPDRLRLAAAEIRFDSYTSATSGSFEQVATSSNVINRAIINNVGDVGIGTTNPRTRLAVMDPSSESLHIQRNSLGYNAYLFFGISEYDVGRIGYYNSDTGGWRDIAINEGGGKVGIGVTNPYATLSVSGNTWINNASGDILVVESTTNTGRSTIRFNTNGNDWELGARGSASATKPNQFYIFDKAADEYRLSIDSTGDIAIGGNYETDAKLEVRDSASQGIIVRSTNTQTTDTNKALRIRNNSDTDTFSISHKGTLVSSSAATYGGELLVDFATSTTNSHLYVRGASGANSREGKIRFGGTFQSAGADVNPRLISSIRSGFSVNNWGNEYLDFYINSTSNDAFSDSNQGLVMRMKYGNNGTPKVLIATSTDTGQTLQVNGSAKIQDYTYHGSDIKTASLYVRGTGNNNNANAFVKLNGTNLFNSGGYRGLALIILNSSLELVSTATYDTFASTAASDSLATALDGMSRNQIGILVSRDAFENALTTNLKDSAREHGLTKLAYLDSNVAARKPYAAVFYGTSDVANALSKEVIERMESADGDANRAVIYTTLSSFDSDVAFTGATSTNALYSADPQTRFIPAVYVDSAGRTNINNTNFTYRPPSNSDLRSSAYLNLTAGGGNYLSFGQYGASDGGAPYAHWIQSAFNTPTTATYSLILQPLGNRVGIGITYPARTLDVNGGVRARGGAPGSGGVNNNGYAFLTPGDNDSGMFCLGDGQINFYANNGERGRFASTYFKVSNNGTYRGGFYHEARSSSSNNQVLIVDAISDAYTSTILDINTTTVSGTGFHFIQCRSGNFTDNEFRIRGDGQIFSDQSSISTPADYAEMFEWIDGNPNNEDRRGITVVLEGDKIREAFAGEEPMGVISGNPAIVADTQWKHWKGKYLVDDYNCPVYEPYTLYQWDVEVEVTPEKEIVVGAATTVQEATYRTEKVSYHSDRIPDDVILPDNYEIITHDDNGKELKRKVLNPDYDSSYEYIERKDRKEWDAVGMMGKLSVRKGQQVGSRWIKMKEISDTVEQWLVR